MKPSDRQVDSHNPPDHQPVDTDHQSVDTDRWPIDNSGAAGERPRPSVVPSVASLLVLAITAVVFAALLAYAASIRLADSEPSWNASHRLIGSCYGWVSGLAWMTTLVRRGWARYASLGLIACVGGWLLTSLGDKSPLQYFANTLGLLAVQTTSFHFVRLARWRLPGQRPLEDPPHAGDSRRRLFRTQFHIFDIVVATLVAAALFTLVQRISIDGSPFTFWGILFWTWVAMPVIAYASFKSAAAGLTPAKRTQWLVISVGVSIFIAWAMSTMEVNFQTSTPRLSVADAMDGYGRVMTGYLLTLWAFTAAAGLGERLETGRAT